MWARAVGQDRDDRLARLRRLCHRCVATSQCRRLHLGAGPRDPADTGGLQTWLLERGVTVTEVPTPLAELLLDLPWPSSCTLRLLITGGDRLHSRPRPEVPFQLLNEYGPTENTATSTAGVVAPMGHTEGLPTIGSPIAGTAAHILDPRMQPRPSAPRANCCWVAQASPGGIWAART